MRNKRVENLAVGFSGAEEGCHFDLNLLGLGRLVNLHWLAPTTGSDQAFANSVETDLIGIAELVVWERRMHGTGGEEKEQ
ncbi:MAG: hypothetical protein ABSG03_23055 [Bryobacteraceae bacterium]|jgi:hypothetical protein